MPSSAVQFRGVCGSFLATYINFMSKRAEKKLASRVAMLRLSRRVDGVTFGFVLSYLFWGGILLRCGDIETNPGPPAPPAPPAHSNVKDSKMQTRLSTTGGLRKVSVEKTSHPGASASPSRSQPTLSDIMASLSALTDQVGSMNSSLNELKNEVHELREDYAALTTELKGLKEDVTDLRNKNRELQKTNSDLCAKMDDYENRLDDLEGRSKRNNLIIYGLPRRDGETSADCEGQLQDLITDKLEMADNVEFDRVHRLNSKPDSPIIARCVFYKHKLNILKCKRKLQGTNVFIGEDFSRRVRDIRRRLTPHLKQARQDSKRATMIFNYLLIDGKRFSVDQDNKLFEVK
eukprot:TRINITY_DN65635_c0_g1_i5.p1 TRINITY_DN65635_c0_g1~~TRINITY_DN65635_c0_g1_i5.p1  ORF type:complete len:347 (+),score=67.10 TRINITY_DN65635_c0_g1_i5:180-1220(+)